MCPEGCFPASGHTTAPVLRRGNWRSQQIPHAHEVIGGGREGENPTDFKQPAQSGLAQLRFVRVVSALLAVKVDGWIAWIIRRRGFAPVFSLKALLTRPRLDQRSIHAEVFVRSQTCGFRLF